MAIKKKKKLDNIKLISSLDSAVDLEKSDWAAYQKSLDEGNLVFVEGEQPTRFLISLGLKWKGQKDMFSALVTGKGDGQVRTGEMLEQARMMITGIENPDNIPEESKLIFVKGADGYLSEDICAELQDGNIITDLFSTITIYKSTSEEDQVLNQKK